MTKIASLGLELTLPAGWFGWVGKEPGDSAAVLQAATVPIAVGDFVGDVTHRQMGPGDCYLKIIDAGLAPEDVEKDTSWSVSDGPLQFRLEDLSPIFEGVELLAYGCRFAVVNGRPLMIYLGFGPSRSRLDAPTLDGVLKAPPRVETVVAPKALANGNSVLASLVA
jgi:hypothetical protein